MEVFDFMPYTYYTRMTGKAGCLRSAGLMSCFYSSRKTDIYRL